MVLGDWGVDMEWCDSSHPLCTPIRPYLIGFSWLENNGKFNIGSAWGNEQGVWSVCSITPSFLVFPWHWRRGGHSL